MKILILNGINLCMTGTRDPGLYGTTSLEEINSSLKAWAKTHPNLELDFYASNYEGALAERLYAARNIFDGVVINAGAWSHYSIGIRDAISAAALPCVEVHMTNVYAREEFRHTQMIAGVCVGQVSGFGDDVYRIAVEALLNYIGKKRKR